MKACGRSVSEDGRGSEPGQTAVVFNVPVVEPIVSPWRDRLDPSAAEGMPAHVTLLFPFVPAPRLTDETQAELQALCAEFAPLAVDFAHTARFPGILYLDPEPADGLRELTTAIAAQWPEAQPYGGLHNDVIPHLTVACADDAVLDAIESKVAPQLPVTARLQEAELCVFDGARWQPRASLPLRNAPDRPL